MRILCLTSRLPYPPDRGDRLRAFYFIEHLAREHDLGLVSFVADAAEYEHVEALRAHCADIRVHLMDARRSALGALSNIWRREPLQALYYHSAAMGRLVDEMVRDGGYDAAYVHLFRMAPYLAGAKNLYRIVDLTDVISQEVSRSLPYRGLAWRMIYGFDGPRIERYERTVAQTFEETWLISEADRDHLSASCPGANIQVVTNGVDAETLAPTGQAREENSLIFVGHLRVFHNVDAVTHLVRDILPLVRRRVPGCTVKIVGADPGPAVMRLEDDPAVTVAGFVPDLNNCLNSAEVFVAPLRFAAGVQNKVLEAMAAGCPVVTSSMVNSGLGAVPGRDLLVADDAAGVAEQVVTLLGDVTLRARIARAGRRFVVQKYSWENVLERMRVIEDRLAAKHSAGLGVGSG